MSLGYTSSMPRCKKIGLDLTQGYAYWLASCFWLLFCPIDEQVVESTANISENTAASAVALAMADGAVNLPVTWFSLSGSVRVQSIIQLHVN